MVRKRIERKRRKEGWKVHKRKELVIVGMGDKGR